LYDGNYEIHSTAEKIGPNHYRIEVDPPWPYDLMYGTYYGFAKRLLPEGSTFTLHKAEKDQGDQRPMVFEIEWT
ncbi:MAG TPA: hypothetical protein VMT24_01830, partial [Aggregatilineaceae bacterium]|nr:hypothetical protein [Aggregatilineaceae bacterium]